MKFKLKIFSQTKKLKASTIVEVMVAFAIIAFVTTLGSIVFKNVQQSNSLFFKTQAILKAENFLEKTLSEKIYTDDIVMEDSYTIKRIINRNPVFSDCILIKIIVFDVNKNKLIELQQLQNIKN